MDTRLRGYERGKGTNVIQILPIKNRFPILLMGV